MVSGSAIYPYLKNYIIKNQKNRLQDVRFLGDYLNVITLNLSYIRQFVVSAIFVRWRPTKYLTLLYIHSLRTTWHRNQKLMLKYTIF